jgi:predicted kinase
MDLVVIAGAPGTGKSTLMTELAARWPTSPAIEFSSLREFHLDRTWSNQSPEEEQLAWENLEFVVRNYVRHGRTPVLTTDFREHRVQMINEVFGDLSLRIVTLTADEAVLRERVTARTEGFTNVEAALSWNADVMARPALEAETKFDTSDVESSELASAVFASLTRSE